MNRKSSTDEQELSKGRCQADGMLAGYLAVLTASLPAGDREMFEEEARNHLAEHAAAYEELGHEPVEAMRTAIDKFGMPMRLARALAEPPASIPGHSIALPTNWVVVSYAALASGVAMTLADFAGIQSHLLHYPGGAAMMLLGMIYGVVAANFILKTRLRLANAAVLTGAVYGPGTLILASLLNGQFPDGHFALITSIIFGIAGIATAIQWINQSVKTPRTTHVERA